MVAVPGVCKEHIGVHVPGIGPADHGVDVLIPVVVYIAEGDAVSLLQVSEAAGRGHVFKTLPAGIAEHSVGHQRSVIRVAGANVEVEPAVVVEVAEVAAHRVEDFVAVGLFGPIDEGAVALVAVEAGRLALMRQAHVIGGHIAGVGLVARDEQVEPAVVVVVPKPHRKAERRLAHARAGGDVGEAPAAVGVWAVVVEEQVGLSEAGDVQVGPAVVVYVAPSHPFDKAYYI